MAAAFSLKSPIGRERASPTKPTAPNLTGRCFGRARRRFRLRVLGIVAPLLQLLSSAAAAQDSLLPAGVGKPVVEEVCSGCHELDTVIMARRTKTGWEDIVSDMATRGATGTDDELSAVVQYLTQFFGKINVNTASAKELEQFLKLEEKVAQAIVDYREKNGKFKELEQLKRIPGVNAEQLQEKRQSIAFNQ
jgi:competence protein ComEA